VSRPVNEPALPTVNILGVPVAATHMQDAVERIFRWIDERRAGYVLLTGVHGIMECQRDPELLDIYRRAAMCAPDGMPTVWLGWTHGHRTMDRVYGPGLMLEVFAQSVERGTRHYLYGGGEGVAEQLRERLVERFPGVCIVGAETPPFRPLTPKQDAALIERIRVSGADLVWVGLSTPKQDRWMADHVGRVHAPVLLGVGAAFDFHTGRLRQAPHPIQRAGLEWAFRLVMEPRRLWRRYLYANPRFIVKAAAQLLGLRRYDTTPRDP